MGNAFSSHTAPVGGGVTPPNLTARKAEAKKSAEKGNADDAWQRMGMKTLRKVSRPAVECVSHSFGRVQAYLVSHPCSSLDRTLFAVGSGPDVVVVSVAWVGFRSRSDARGLRDIENVHGSGDIRPLATTLLDMADIRFTAHNFDSRIDGNTVVIAETEPASGRVDPAVLDAMAEIAAHLPRP